jgi:hypothetical protein
MYGKGTLAATGVGFTLWGMQMSLSLAAAIAVLFVVVGGLGYRYGKRGSRYVTPQLATATENAMSPDQGESGYGS